MLRSRLFRNVGIPPPLRSLIVPHPALSPSIITQLRFRLGLLQHPVYPSSSLASASSTSLSNSSSSSSQNGPSSAPSASTSRRAASSQSHNEVFPPPMTVPSPSRTAAPVAEEPVEPRLSLTFTCTVTGCAERSTHQFTRRSYERGIVLVTCPKCKNRHLIADHLGWFKSTDGTDGGQLKTLEDIMRSKGEKVTRGRLDAGGVVEYSE